MRSPGAITGNLYINAGFWRYSYAEFLITASLIFTVVGFTLVMVVDFVAGLHNFG